MPESMALQEETKNGQMLLGTLTTKLACLSTIGIEIHKSIDPERREMVVRTRKA